MVTSQWTFSRLIVLLLALLAGVYVLRTVTDVSRRSSYDELAIQYESRLSKLESDLMARTQELRTAKDLKLTQENMLKDTKASLDDKQTEMKDVQSKYEREIEDLNHQINNLKKESAQLVEDEKAREREKEQESDHHQVPVNSRFMKSEFVKEEPKYQKVTYRAKGINTDENEMVVLTSIAHSASYGEERSFVDFIKLIESIEFERTMSTLGLLVGNKEEYYKILKFIESNEDVNFFSKVVVIQSQFIEDLYTLDRDQRHSLSVQKERRRAISRARNFLVSNALTDETYSLCLDSDMLEIPPDLVEIFVNSQKDIIVPRIRQGGAQNYDFNSWVGTRKTPDKDDERRLDDNDPEFLFVPGPLNAAHMHDFVNDAATWNNDGSKIFSVEIDSVGGAILFLKSEIFKQGIMFPPFYIVGTKWERFEGYDGIETEGLCYQARTIGYKCWGMPNLVAFHVPETIDG